MSQSSEILMSFCAGKIGARQLSPETHEKNLAYLCEVQILLQEDKKINQ